MTVQALPPGWAATPDAPDTFSLARPILTRTHLLLPELTPGLQRAAVAHAAAHRLHSTPGQSPAALKPLALAVAGAIEDARVEQLLARGLPGVRVWFDAPLRAALEPEGLSFAALLSRLDLALHDEQHIDGNHWVNKARALFDAARREHGLEDAPAFRRLAFILANDLGQMRVRHEPQRFAVPAPYRDDHSYLWEHEQRSDSEQTLQAPPADSRSNLGAAAMDPVLAIHHYPEWNWRAEQLREDWCTLHELAPLEFPVRATSNADTAHPRREPRLRPHPTYGRRLRRQPDGEQIDLDAAIEAEVDRRLGRVHPGRVFQRPGPHHPSLSLLLLLDSSQSTGDRDARGHRLLALEQQAAWLLAQTVHATQGRIAIHAFNSDTRTRVRYQRLLDFGRPLDALAQARLQALQPVWSTRLGTALRHAARLLATERSERRVLVVLSDGAPSDIDVHDGHYLIEDARQAVREAARLGLPVHGLIVDPAAAGYARRIFGTPNHRLLAHAGQLQSQLMTLHARFAGS